ncbi:tyrosine-type recombinase/integrase [Rhodoblastus sp.]|uniref:tyrosine-type recombinase/integrase n=1 Tax=Rhodoblastus sp. TaxID=1962975 RepID=UPI003F96E984
MPRSERRLTARQVSALTAPGRYPDGGGLYLEVKAPSKGGDDEKGRKTWLWRYRRAGKRRDMGLGAVDDVTLAEVRAEREKWRDVLRTGADPIEERAREKAKMLRRGLTFGEAADAYIAERLGHYKRARHREAWKQTLDAYAGALRPKPVADISTADVLGAVAPIWLSKSPTAKELRRRIETIIDSARALGHIDEARANPARWRGHLDKLLPRQKPGVAHFRAMDWREVPAFIQRLRAANFAGARALEFLILTATRTNETLGAEWPEVDLDASVWTIPKERMKAGREHRVPLPARAVEILRQVKETRPSQFLFHGVRPRETMSERTLSAILHRWKVPATVHGFRSAFSDWRGEATNFPSELAEVALAHVVGDSTERAYRRGDALERRKALMDAWAKFIDGKSGATVIPLRARKQP